MKLKTSPAYVAINKMVLSASVGIETFGGVFTPLFDKNTPIPSVLSEVFSTANDNQGKLDISCYQGDAGFVDQNYLIGNYQISGIDPRPKGVPQIKVKFVVKEDGKFIVLAKEANSNLKIIFNGDKKINNDVDTNTTKEHSGSDDSEGIAMGAIEVSHLGAASEDGRVEDVKKLLKAGADVNDVGYAATPLYLASGQDHTEVVKLLLEAGADANIADKNGDTPLYVATQKGYAEVVKLLER